MEVVGLSADEVMNRATRGNKMTNHTDDPS